jgi:hypothetical protein
LLKRFIIKYHQVTLRENFNDGRSRDLRMAIGEGGVWQIDGGHEMALIETLHADRDRAAAIIAACVV